MKKTPIKCKKKCDFLTNNLVELSYVCLFKARRLVSCLCAVRILIGLTYLKKKPKNCLKKFLYGDVTGGEGQLEGWPT